jgi:restriction system protein
MPVPDYQSLMLPLLKLVADGKEYRTRDVLDPLAKEFNLLPPEQEQLLPSGRQTVFYDRVHWAKTYMSQAKLVSRPRWGFFQITDRGQEAIKQAVKQNPSKPKIDLKFLEQYDEFKQFRELSEEGGANKNESSVSISAKLDEIPTGLTPDEQVEAAQKNVEASLARDLRTEILKKDDKFFEALVLELLKKAFPNLLSARLTGGPGDRGIDGILADRFGLEEVRFQAKHYAENNISSQSVRLFCNDVGHGRGTKGIFVTLSRFTPDAKKVANEHPPHNVRLIDGEELLKLLIEYDVGVKCVNTIKIRKIDADYFAGEE